jgi:predicted house-cleaning noncanonical NTP pyrophosphatase (MazG superfamily)
MRRGAGTTAHRPLVTSLCRVEFGQVGRFPGGNLEGRVKQYDKLVRDLVPGILRAKGHRLVTRTLVGKELTDALRAKIDEEAAEYDAAADDEHAAMELADLLEVVMALARRRGFSEARIDELRAEKAAQRGAFDRAVFLISAE